MTPGDPRGAGTDDALVEDEGVLTAALAADRQLPGQMPRGGEPVNPRAEDHVTAGGREGRVGHRFTLLLVAPRTLVLILLPLRQWYLHIGRFYRGENRQASNPSGRCRATGDRHTRRA